MSFTQDFLRSLKREGKTLEDLEATGLVTADEVRSILKRNNGRGYRTEIKELADKFDIPLYETQGGKTYNRVRIEEAPDFGSRLRVALEARNMTVAELANVTGIPPFCVKKLLCGESKDLSPDKLYAVSRALEVRMETLLGVKQITARAL